MFLSQPWTSWHRKSNMASRLKPFVPRGEITRSQLIRKQMQFKHVTLDIDGSVAILKLDHPEVMNAVSMDMLGGIGDALDAADDRRGEVRCLVMTGAGRAFCAGANLQGRDNQQPGSRSNAA